MASNDEAVASDLRKADPDRYLSTLYAPAEKRMALTALYAFDAEIASIRDKVTQPLAGEMRIQWCRDQLLAVGPDAVMEEQGHPVLSALSAAIIRYKLPVTTFENYLEARIFDLYDDPMPSTTDLEGYCGETSSALLQLSALVLDPVNAMRYAEASGYGGCAQGIVTLIRAMPLHRRRGQCYVPADILNATGLSAEQFNAASDERSSVAMAALAAVARQHFRDFERVAKGMPASLRPAFMPLAVTGYYLDAIEADPARFLGSALSISPLRRHLCLLRRALRGW